MYKSQKGQEIILNQRYQRSVHRLVDKKKSMDAKHHDLITTQNQTSSSNKKQQSIHSSQMLSNAIDNFDVSKKDYESALNLHAKSR